MILKRDEELAIKGYEAYGAETGHMNYQGNPMPIWEALLLKIRDAWVAAARAIAAAAISGTVSR